MNTMQDAGRTRLETAAEWLQRIDRVDATDEDLHAWLAWCEQSPEDRWAFEEMQTLDSRLREMPEALKDELREEFGGREDRTGWVRRYALAASVFLMLGAGTVIYSLWPTPDVYSTARGEHRTVMLSDGSEAVLGADSVIEVDFSRSERQLTISRGEAYFTVRHDPQRPFQVTAGPVTVTAVGTAFNVERGHARVTVAVTEGAVKVGTLQLDAGRRAVLPDDGPPELSAMDPATVTAWQHGQLQFSNEPLSVVLDSVNRYAKREVVIGEPEVEQMRYTGTVVCDQVEEWVDNLPLVFKLTAVKLKDGTVIWVRRSE